MAKKKQAEENVDRSDSILQLQSDVRNLKKDNAALAKVAHAQETRLKSYRSEIEKLEQELSDARYLGGQITTTQDKCDDIVNFLNEPKFQGLNYKKVIIAKITSTLS